MEILAFAAAFVIGLVFMAERLAFAVLVYMLTRWAWRYVGPLWATLRADLVTAYAWCRARVQALRHWWAMRALRGQLQGGATP